tara:strand:+ start:1145 stop:1630 length:486 start_codon:yes stop_codon:yes gene_type:complete
MKNKKEKYWDDHFKTVPASSVLPLRVDASADTYCDILDMQVRALNKLDPQLYNQYRKGQLMKGPVDISDEQYTEILRTIIKCIFQCIRENINENIQVLEDRQDELIKVSSAEGVFLSGIEVLKTMKIKLDVNSVFAIIYGYIGQSFGTIAKNYEDTRRIKH